MLESLVVLAIMYANVSVPVVPDPNYLQQLYPQQPPQFAATPFQAPFQQQQLQNGQVTQSELTGATQPMDIMSIINMAVTGGLAFMLNKNKTTTDRRTYMAADTTLKLAQNDQNSDVKVIKLTYALSCLCDIIGKHHREDLETYQTTEGTSLWTYIESLNIENNEDFKARYLNKPPVETTGSQSKDKVVATFNKVQQSITPTPTTAAPDTTKTKQPTTRTDVNKQTNVVKEPSVGIDTD